MFQFRRQEPVIIRLERKDPLMLHKWIGGLLLLGFTIFPRYGIGQGTTPVGQWDRFEARVANTRGYANPYADVELNVTYTGPDGRQVSFWGFYDGGTTWKIRLKP